MARFANMPEPEYREDREFVKAAKVTSHFDASRYEVKPIDTEKMPLLYSQRGLSSETVKDLSPYLVLLRDKQNDKFDGYNVAFPYTDKDDKVKGYEYVVWAVTNRKPQERTPLLRLGWLTCPVETVRR